MAQENLRELLAQLHSRLNNARSLDADARKLLTTVSEDIEKVLARDDAETAPAKSNLESLAVRLEAEHPAVAHVARQLIDALSKAGI